MKKSKRYLLKGLAVSSVWTTPVVSSVVLPAHASSTGGCSSVSPGQYAGGSSIAVVDANLGGSVLDYFIMPAHSQESCPDPSRVIGVCLSVDADCSVGVSIVTNSQITNEFSGAGTVSGVELSGNAGDYMVSGIFDIDSTPQQIAVKIEGPCPEVNNDTPYETTITAVFEGECPEPPPTIE